jgi:S-adenosylmethionine synthetase
VIRTAESVTPMHPDKVCDRISDAILDDALRQDPNSRVAIETMGGHGIITITGEMKTAGFVNCHQIARKIAGNVIGVTVNVGQQSPDIARGVDTGGAGDQGIMVGYACDDNEWLVPQEHQLSRSLCQHIYSQYPADGKTQITIGSGGVESILASFNGVENDLLVASVADWAAANGINPSARIMCNPAGYWFCGGFDADTGLTGRKLAVDNYGPGIPIGGGAYSGKDPTKVDRSAAYMARKIARDILIAENAHKVYVYLAYAIGIAQPTMATSLVDGKERPVSGYDLTPTGIIEYLGLRSPIYERTAEWGHYGHSGFAWER